MKSFRTFNKKQILYIVGIIIGCVALIAACIWCAMGLGTQNSQSISISSENVEHTSTCSSISSAKDSENPAHFINQLAQNNITKTSNNDNLAINEMYTKDKNKITHSSSAQKDSFCSKNSFSFAGYNLSNSDIINDRTSFSTTENDSIFSANGYSAPAINTKSNDYVTFDFNLPGNNTNEIATLKLLPTDCQSYYRVSNNDGLWPSTWIECTDGVEITVNINQKIQFKGGNINNTQKFGGTFLSSQQHKVSGNLFTLVYGEDAPASSQSVNLTIDRCFENLFSRGMTSVKDEGLVDVSDLILNANFSITESSLPTEVFNNMFRYCPQLQKGPKFIISGTPGEYCFNNMFSYSAISDVSNLDITILLNKNIRGTFYNMFHECFALQAAPKINVTGVAGGGTFYGMFGMSEQSSLIDASKINIDVTIEDNFQNAENNSTRYVFFEMFRECVSLKTAPQIKVTGVAGEGCFSGMFNMFHYWAWQYSKDAVPKSQLADVSAINIDVATQNNAKIVFSEMFRECITLHIAPQIKIAGSIVGESCFCDMFRMTNDIYHYSLPAAKISDASNIEIDITVQSNAQEVFYNMFYSCANLKFVPVIKVKGIVGSSCFESMFYGCALTNFNMSTWDISFSNSSQVFKNMFAECLYLENLTVPFISFCANPVSNFSGWLNCAEKRLTADAPILHCKQSLVDEIKTMSTEVKAKIFPEPWVTETIG